MMTTNLSNVKRILNSERSDFLSETKFIFGNSENNNTLIKKGDIYYANLSPVVGSEQGGTRPIVVIQNDVGNRFSPTVIVAAITSHDKRKLPTHIKIKSGNDSGLPKDSVVLLEQIRTLDKKRLLSKLGTLNLNMMQIIDEALLVSFGLSFSSKNT
ncbi:MAG: type II toxin-antitoxin system PemK/MazF family toxin [Candidatus Improbicoccus pseudotrichonymphae]|uniref:Type II toxin-antitoxin system PemK/MazF family toxin n=1 Tax=Candidatus Improbicoccus pseudotrichonymphae TaxID=3033792 RepID=A0AA48IB94_9FIRM|nr:MAG: type II toxin-antitoxin system PemK/MazF family toxin [Candidatus Improbicoccus pseudotrichonymphae]